MGRLKAVVGREDFGAWYDFSVIAKGEEYVCAQEITRLFYALQQVGRLNLPLPEDQLELFHEWLLRFRETNRSITKFNLYMQAHLPSEEIDYRSLIINGRLLDWIRKLGASGATVSDAIIADFEKRQKQLVDLALQTPPGQPLSDL